MRRAYIKKTTPPSEALLHIKATVRAMNEYNKKVKRIPYSEKKKFQKYIETPKGKGSLARYITHLVRKHKRNLQ